MYPQRRMHPQFQPRPGSAPVDPYGMAPAVPQGAPQQPNMRANPLAQRVQRARPAAPQGGGMAVAAQQAQEAQQVAMGRPGIGALTVPTPTDEKNVGYGATAAPFIGMAAMFPPLAPVAAAFGAASLAEQYLSNKERSRNPSELPREWASYTPEMQNAWAMNQDSGLAERMLSNDVATEKDGRTSDEKWFDRINQELTGQGKKPLTIKQYRDDWQHKGTSEVINLLAMRRGLDLPDSERLLAGGKTTGAEEAKYLTARNDRMKLIVEETEPKLVQAYNSTKALLAAFESGKYDTGPVTGRIGKFFDADIAGLTVRSIATALENLKRANLAPVTENEMTLMMKMSQNPEFRTEANIGILREVLREMEETGQELAPRSDWYREHGTMAGYHPTITRPWSAAPDTSPAPAAAPAGPDPASDPLLRPMP